MTAWTAGAPASKSFSEAVKDMTPEWAAEICDLDADDIRGSARLYANAKPGAIQWGLAFDQQLSAMALCLAGCDLMAICGNVDVPGGNILVHNAFECNAGYASGESFTPPEWRAKKLNNSFALSIEGGDFVAHASSDGLSAGHRGRVPVPHQDDVDPVVQHPVLPRHGCPARSRSHEEDSVHRERRPVPHADFGRRRGHPACRSP